MRSCLILLATLVTAATHATAAATAHASDRPNVVVLYADDWRHDTLGAAGHPVLRTPHLDALAGRGVRFTDNYVTTAICGVSRANLLTGQWASRNGCTGFDRFTTPFDQTYPGRLGEAGYHVGHVGKWHNGKFPAKEYDFGRSYFGKHWYRRDDGTPVHVTARNQEDAVEFLQTRPTTKPFCLTVAFFATHAEDRHPEQFLPQPQSMDLYKDDTMRRPTNANDESFHRLPDFIANEGNEGRNRYHWRFDEPYKYQTMMRNYYRLASEVDAVCGRVIELLEQQGVRDNTLIIFTTDNGYYHGEHGLADKWYPHAESIRVPLIIDDPRMDDSLRGTTNDAMTLSVDLAPTILEFAGTEVPDRMQGRDLATIYQGNRSEWRREFFYEHPTIRNINFIPSSEALVRKDWKLMHWPDFDRYQLFDLVNDPREENDLIGDGQQSERIAEMKSALARLRDAAK